VSSALAIAGVTQVLRDLLNDELVNANVSGIVGQSVTVTTLPLDRVVPENGTEVAQLNVFLRHITPNLAWRNEGLPSRDNSGRSRLTNPPLALDLHYLISAYGAEPLHAEILLGHAMQLLHENPAIPREAVRQSLEMNIDPHLALPEALRALVSSGLADQVEQLRITPEYLSTEEIAKFWTATLAHYRPCAAYQVSVVLIQKENPLVQPLPVLVRNLRASPGLVPALPTLSAVTSAAKLPVGQLGAKISLDGSMLAGSGVEVHLSNDRFRIDEVLTPTGGTGTRIDFEIPAARAADFPAGLYRVAAQLQATGDDQVRRTNDLGLTLAPSIDGAPIGLSRSGNIVTFQLKCLPHVRSGQTARLALGNREFVAKPFAPPDTAILDFDIVDVPAGEYPASLRIDGIGSPMIDVEASPPAFSHKIVIP
jgi:hypothetical protein